MYCDIENKYVVVNQNAIDTCCFIGCEKNEPAIYDNQNILFSLSIENISKAIKSLIKKGFKYFISSFNTNFEIACGKVVISLKKSYKNIKLYYVLDNDEDNENIKNNSRKKYLFENADKKIKLISDSPFLVACNRFLIDNSALVLSLDKLDKEVLEYTTKKRIIVKNVSKNNLYSNLIVFP